MSFEAAAYELDEIWRPGWFPDADRERVRAVAAHVPDTARTVLDVGCGNGLFLDELARAGAGRFRRLVGTDRSGAALAHVKGPKCRARIEQLPFAAGAFDLVTCLEVLEHLPMPVFAGALGELCRVSGRHLLVVVPNEQDLEASLCRCPMCHARFNGDFHVRRFDESVLTGLFDRHGFGVAAVFREGRDVSYRDWVLRRRLEAWWRGTPAMPPYAICPVCGFHEPARLKEELGRREAAGAGAAAVLPRRRLHALLSRARPTVTTYRWIGALYERRG